MRRCAALVAGLVVVTAGCGSDGEATPAGVKVDRAKPCAAVTTAALTKAFGTTFSEAGKSATLPSGNVRCTWTGGKLTFSLDIAKTTTSNYDSDVDDKDGAIAFNRTKPRVGQDSVFLSDPETVYEQKATLSVLSGSNEWHLIVSGGGRYALQPKLLALGKTIFV